MIDWPDITFPPINLYTYPKTMNKDARYTGFKQKLSRILIESGIEDLSNTPEHVLSEYLVTCLKAFNNASVERSIYYTKIDQYSTTEEK
jgi:hypothetical protein